MTIDFILCCKALSCSTREQILEAFQSNEEMCVTEIVKLFHLTQPTISHHLDILKSANLVINSRSGKSIYYKLNQSAIIEFHNIFRQKFISNGEPK